jgi:hypothetical protein
MEEMYETLDNCPNCSIAPAFGPRMMIVHYPENVIAPRFRQSADRPPTSRLTASDPQLPFESLR